MSKPVDPKLRQSLIRAATSEFARRGYAATSIDSIGGEAGVTKGGVYFHFRTKEQLFFAALDHWRSELRAAVGGDEGADGAEQLRSMLRRYLEYHFDHPDGSRLLDVLTNELGDSLTKELRGDAPAEQRDLRARIRELLTRGVHDGSLYVDDPAFAAFSIASSVRGVIAQWLTSPADSEPYCNAETLAAAMVRGYATGARRAESAADEFGGPF